MGFLGLILVFAIILIVLAFVFDINLQNFKQMKSIGEDKNLSKITDKLPSNIKVCKDILKKINNTKVEVEENKDSSTSLYIAITDKIHIANVKDSFTRIQTIAHECIHSIQNRKILLFNFYYSNAYLFYFISALIMLICKAMPYKNICISIFIMLSFVYYVVRTYLENDAMIKARYLAKEYIEEQEVLTKEEVNQVVNKYDELNNIGVKWTNFNLFLGTVIKVIILLIICIIR